MDENIRFGEYLKLLIKEAGLTQTEFYTKLGIKKPYFYDIVSGRVNPPPPPLQFKTVEILQIDRDGSERFFNLAARERGELPADITEIISKNPDAITSIRNSLCVFQNTSAFADQGKMEEASHGD